MKKEITEDEMLVRMAGLCAGAEQCSIDIREKILKKGFSKDAADRMLRYLIENKYINDERYAKAYVADKVRFSGWGRIKIRMYLKSKKIPEMAIMQGFETLKEEDYEESLNRVLSAKARSLDLSEVKDRQKLYRHLASRGFESSVIIPAIRKHIVSQSQDQ